VPFRDSKLTRILQDALVSLKFLQLVLFFIFEEKYIQDFNTMWPAKRYCLLAGWQLKSGIAVLLFSQPIECTREFVYASLWNQACQSISLTLVLRCRNSLLSLINTLSGQSS